MEDKKIATLAEVKDIFLKRQSEQELTGEQKLALEHCQKFSRLDAKKSRKLAKELLVLDFVNDSTAVKLVDIMPTLTTSGPCSPKSGLPWRRRTSKRYLA